MLVGLIGVVAVIVGTFLPWLDSGTRGHNIYELVGVAGKLGFLDTGLARTIPTIVSLLGPACILPVVLALLRLRRTAAILAVACGALTAVPAVAVLLLGDRAEQVGIGVDPTGPVVVLVGGVLLITAGVLGLTVRRGRHHAGAPASQGHEVTVRAREDRTAP